MYNRLNGTIFTAKNKEEQSEVIQQINRNPKFSEFLTCVGLDVEQFTGKIKSALVKSGNKFIKFSVTGTYPVMKLDQIDSNNVFVIEFPNERQKEIKLPEEKAPVVVEVTKPEIKKEIEIPAVITEETLTEEEEHPVSMETSPVEEHRVVTEENPIGRRSRNKKQLKY